MAHLVALMALKTAFHSVREEIKKHPKLKKEILDEIRKLVENLHDESPSGKPTSPTVHSQLVQHLDAQLDALLDTHSCGGLQARRYAEEHDGERYSGLKTFSAWMENVFVKYYHKQDRISNENQDVPEKLENEWNRFLDEMQKSVNANGNFVGICSVMYVEVENYVLVRFLVRPCALGYGFLRMAVQTLADYKPSQPKNERCQPKIICLDTLSVLVENEINQHLVPSTPLRSKELSFAHFPAKNIFTYTYTDDDWQILADFNADRENTTVPSAETLMKFESNGLADTTLRAMYEARPKLFRESLLKYTMKNDTRTIPGWYDVPTKKLDQLVRVLPDRTEEYEPSRRKNWMGW